VVAIDTLRDDKFVRLNDFWRMTPLPGEGIVRPSKRVLADSFIFAFGRRNRAHPSSVTQKMN
jgi:hypothetical protein